MYSWFFKLGVFLLITGCSSYKFDESLLKLNENEEIGAVGQITPVTSESQRNFLNDRAATLLNAELGEEEAIELMPADIATEKVLRPKCGTGLIHDQPLWCRSCR